MIKNVLGEDLLQQKNLSEPGFEPKSSVLQMPQITRPIVSHPSFGLAQWLLRVMSDGTKAYWREC